MYYARYVLMDQALRGGGVRSTKSAVLVYYIFVYTHHYLRIIVKLVHKSHPGEGHSIVEVSILEYKLQEY